ncbi:hypothetical protein L6452_31573 [Arctium lappa]|uniref:Uncharacterized protein n=1 Tax=Arctium lappa TaxID=4217 RepID=A0ACB8Z2T3_ARCLA|nr:hypothetical protein L6452_31573 [Arctium lappa]
MVNRFENIEFKRFDFDNERIMVMLKLNKTFSLYKKNSHISHLGFFTFLIIFEIFNLCSSVILHLFCFSHKRKKEKEKERIILEVFFAASLPTNLSLNPSFLQLWVASIFISSPTEIFLLIWFLGF